MPKLNTFAQVRQLTGWHAQCFAAALLARMTPNYRLFAEVVNLPSPAVLDNVLALVWESLTAPKSKINFALQREKVEEASPDINDYDAFGVYPANDACMAMVALLNLLTKDDVEGAVVVSKLSQGGVEAYLLASGESTESEVNTHPLMQFEIDLQQALLDLLREAPSNKATVSQARELALEENISNIGLSLL